MLSFYNKHYILVDSTGNIIIGWSDGPNPEKDTTNAICINNNGSYQFRLYPEGEENPPLHDINGIPLYRYINQRIISRTEDEIIADSIKLLQQYEH